MITILNLNAMSRSSQIVPRLFSLDHARNNLVRMPRFSIIVWINLHDITGIVNLQFRVFIENFHRHRLRSCLYVRAALRNMQKLTVLVQFIIFTETVFWKLTKRQIAIINCRSVGRILRRCTQQMINVISAIRVLLAINISSVVKATANGVHINISRLHVLIGEQEIFMPRNGAEAVTEWHTPSDTTMRLSISIDIKWLETAAVPSKGVYQQQNSVCILSIFYDDSINKGGWALFVSVFICIVTHMQTIWRNRIFPTIIRCIAECLMLDSKCRVNILCWIASAAIVCIGTSN